MYPYVDYRTIDRAVAQEAYATGRNLSVAWIDYQKAFDKVPHLWLKSMLRAIRAPVLVRRTMGKIMGLWKTGLQIPMRDGVVRETVSFKIGLYQGDSLSPLLFALVVSPLSSLLGVAGGFHSAYHRSPVTHLMFVDDLKIYEESAAELQSTLEVAEGLSVAVGMTLELFHDYPNLIHCCICHSVQPSQMS